MSFAHRSNLFFSKYSSTKKPEYFGIATSGKDKEQLTLCESILCRTLDTTKRGLSAQHVQLGAPGNLATWQPDLGFAQLQRARLSSPNRGLAEEFTWVS